MHGKRALDLAVCLLLLPMAVPAMAVIAVAVLISSGRPVFYHAIRMGRGGEAFAMLKFRTMHPVTGPAITRADDTRVTSIGRPLRRTKLDEMPSLLNVLRGDMSLVGPRPEDPRYLPYYSTEERKVLSMSPGVTGPAALRFRDEEQLLCGVPAEQLEHTYTSVHLHEKLRLDLDYIRRARWLPTWPSWVVQHWCPYGDPRSGKSLLQIPADLGMRRFPGAVTVESAPGAQPCSPASG